MVAHDVSRICQVVGGELPHGEIPGGVAGRVAGGSMGEIVGTPQGVHEPERVRLVGLGIVDPEDRFGAVFQEDDVDLLGDLLIGLLPGDRLKPPVHLFQRGADPIGIVHVMEISVTLGAEDALVAVGLRVAFDPPDAPVFHKGEEGAAIPAPVADGGDAADGRLGARLGPGSGNRGAPGKGRRRSRRILSGTSAAISSKAWFACLNIPQEIRGHPDASPSAPVLISRILFLTAQPDSRP